jgi:DNA repair protein RadC
MKQYHQKQDDFPKALAQPARRALAGAGYHRLDQLAEVSEAEISKLHGIGENAINQLKLAMEAKGLKFKD